jgi:long-chain fatty acid transport protein
MPKLSLGASLDYVWAMLDVGMVANRDQVMGMSGMEIGPGNVASITYSDSNDFTGKAKGSGWAGKLGMTYKVSPTLTLGAAYHSKTNISNLETGDAGANMTIYNGATPINSMTGKMTVIDFQWPETFAAGLAFQATPKLMIAADIRRIMWAEAMKDFRMSFAGTGFTIPQEWRNQNVYALGLQYKVDDKLGLHAGLNYGKNPVPDTWLHPLFPATVERHATAGFDYRVSDKGCVAVAVSYAPEVSDTTASGLTIKHSQLSAMVGYNHHF